MALIIALPCSLFFLYNFVMLIKTKLKLVLVLVVALVIILLFPTPNDEGTSSDGSLSVGSGDLELNENLNATGLPVATTEWDFVLLTDLTGPNSDAGVAAAWGFDYGIKSVNENGGPRGVAVRSAIRDTASVPERAAAEMSIVVTLSATTPEALLVFGPVVPQQYDAAAESFMTAKVPVVGNMSGKDSLSKFAPYAVSGDFEPGIAAEKAMSSWLEYNNGSITKIAMIYDSSIEALQENADSAQKAISSAGLGVPAMVSVSGDDFDPKEIAAKAYNHGVDAYYLDLPGDGNIRVFEQLVQMTAGTDPRMLLGTYNMDASALLSMNIINSEMLTVWSEYDLEANMAGRLAFKDAFDTAIGNDSYYSLSADYCQAAQFAMQAIEQLELTGDPSRIVEERELMTTYLRNCNLVLSPLGSYWTINGEKIMQPLLYNIKNGKYSLVR